MTERAELVAAAADLEKLRDRLGNAAVSAALAGIHQRLRELDGAAATEVPEQFTPESAGERRVVTALFCDVAGSTALAEQMDPEEWAAIMNDAFERLIAPVQRYEGLVSRLLGDALLAFFGAPSAHEDDPQRAILAALEMIEALHPLRQALQRERDIEFNVRIGINTGLAVVAGVGSEFHGEYTAMGDAVNVAARMEQTAAPGTIQISADTYSLVAPLFEVEPLGAIKVKGKAQPVEAYHILGRMAQPGRLRGLTTHGIISPLIGRDSEMAATQRVVDDLVQGRGGIMTILGEAGIGKSRLLAELRHYAKRRAQRELRWLEGHTLSYSQAIGYWPFQEILRNYAGISEEDDEAAAWRKLEDSIRGLFGEQIAEVLPYLATLLAIDVTETYRERVRYLEGEALGVQIFRASRRFFTRLAARAPLVLVFDDLHWADASSAGLLEHLLPLVKQVPLLLIGVSRPDPSTPAAALATAAELSYADFYTVLDLQPLSPANSDELVQRLLNIEGLSQAMRSEIVRKADGNPFYIEEIVRDLIDAGAIVSDPASGGWRATHRIEEIAVPDTIQGLLLARIDRLDGELKHVLRWAAVIGRTFLVRVLDMVLETNMRLEDQLHALEEAQLIQEKQQFPEPEYVFKHALAHEAAYESILVKERRQLHARVGAAIETVFVGRLEEFYGLLAFHFSAAEQWDKAQDYLFKAGDQASNIAADAEALASYRLAIKAYARVRGDEWQPLDRARLERKIGEALFRMGEHQQAIPYLERAMALLGHKLPETRWGIRLAIIGGFLRQGLNRLILGRSTGRLGAEVNPLAKEFYLASISLGWIDRLADEERSLLLAVQALNVCERLGHPFGAANLAATIGTVFDNLGSLRLSNSYFRLAAFYEQHTSPPRPCFQLEYSLTVHFNFRGDFARSLEHAHRAAEIGDQIGNVYEWGSALDMAGWALYLLGRLVESLQLREEMLDVAGEGSDRQVVCLGLAGKGGAQRRLGRMGEAVTNLRRAIALAERLPDYSTLLLASDHLARCYLVNDDLDGAMEVLNFARGIADTTPVGRWTNSYLANGFAKVYLTKAERSSGGVRRRWLDQASRACAAARIAARTNRPTRSETLLMLGSHDWLRDKPDRAQRWWQRGLIEARDTGERYMEGQIYLEIGKRLGDRDQLRRAQTILDEIGAASELPLATP